MVWHDYGYVVASSHRMKVIRSLSSHPKTPKQISIEANLSLSHVSRALKELLTKGLVSCVNPDEVKGRVYKLTEVGDRVAIVIERNHLQK